MRPFFSKLSSKLLTCSCYAHRAEVTAEFAGEGVSVNNSSEVQNDLLTLYRKLSSKRCSIVSVDDTRKRSIQNV